MYDQICKAIQGAVWPIHPAKLEEILGVVRSRALGIRLDAETMQGVVAANQERRQSRITRSVAVLPVFGTIAHRMDLMSEFSGGTSTERLGKEFDRLLADDEVGAIVLDVDSPGGTAWGVPELAAKIHEARGRKPITAVANAYMASAAYWIGSAADEIVATTSADVGSIGALAVHYDFSEQNLQAGVKPTYVTYGRYKAEANPDAPLAEESLAYLQARVDEIGDRFVRAVARHRGTTPAEVKKHYGEGRMFGADEAKQRGMVDRIETLEDTIARLSGARPSKPRGRRLEAARRRLDLYRR